MADSVLRIKSKDFAKDYCVFLPKIETKASIGLNYCMKRIVA